MVFWGGLFLQSWHVSHLNLLRPWVHFQGQNFHSRLKKNKRQKVFRVTSWCLQSHLVVRLGSPHGAFRVASQCIQSHRDAFRVTLWCLQSHSVMHSESLRGAFMVTSFTHFGFLCLCECAYFSAPVKTKRLQTFSHRIPSAQFERMGCSDWTSELFIQSVGVSVISSRTWTCPAGPGPNPLSCCCDQAFVGVAGCWWAWL